MLSFFLRPLNSAFLAALVYGGWADYSNIHYGYWVAFKAACVQGIYAFIATLTLGTLTLRLFRIFGQNRRAMVLSFITSLSLMVALPYSIHLFLGTPNILLSMAPGLIWGSGYLAMLLLNQQKVMTD